MAAEPRKRTKKAASKKTAPKRAATQQPAVEVKKELPKAPPVRDEAYGGQAESPADSSVESKGMWLGAAEIFKQIFAQIRKNPRPALVLIVGYAILATLDWLYYRHWPVPKTAMDTVRRSMFQNIGSLLFLQALPTYALALADRREISVGKVFKFEANRYFSILLATIISIGIFVISSIPLLIPLIWTIPWFVLASYVIADKGVGPVEGLSISKRLAQNYKAQVWGVIGMALLVNLAAVMVAAIFGRIIVVVVAITTFASVWSVGSMAATYRWLQKQEARSE